MLLLWSLEQVFLSFPPSPGLPINPSCWVPWSSSRPDSIQGCQPSSGNGSSTPCYVHFPLCHLSSGSTAAAGLWPRGVPGSAPYSHLRQFLPGCWPGWWSDWLGYRWRRWWFSGWGPCYFFRQIRVGWGDTGALVFSAYLAVRDLGSVVLCHSQSLPCTFHLANFYDFRLQRCLGVGDH